MNQFFEKHCIKFKNVLRSKQQKSADKSQLISFSEKKISLYNLSKVNEFPMNKNSIKKQPKIAENSM